MLEPETLADVVAQDSAFWTATYRLTAAGRAAAARAREADEALLEAISGVEDDDAALFGDDNRTFAEPPEHGALLYFADGSDAWCAPVQLFRRAADRVGPGSVHLPSAARRLREHVQALLASGLVEGAGAKRPPLGRARGGRHRAPVREAGARAGRLLRPNAGRPPPGGRGARRLFFEQAGRACRLRSPAARNGQTRGLRAGEPAHGLDAMVLLERFLGAPKKGAGVGRCWAGAGGR